MTKNKFENEDENGDEMKNAGSFGWRLHRLAVVAVLADNASLPATPPDSTNGDKPTNKSMKKSNSLARVLGTATKKKGL
jgi:hypothetical protein